MAEPAVTPASTNGLTVALSEGAEQPQATEAVPVGETQPLTTAEVQPVLDRLPPLETGTALTEAFKLPPESLPPPIPGATIDQPFPPAVSGPTPEAPVTGPLEVLRYAPEDEIPVAPFLNVTFNQPMVPLTTLDELTAQDVPVKLTPEVPGVWKWLGTKTLSFEYRSDELNRFPMATEFTVEVPAGTTSASGGVLATTVTWKFTTAPPMVVSTYPASGPQRRDPILFVAFDQPIDPPAVLATIAVLAGRDTYKLRLATDEEVAADEQVSEYARLAQGGRWLAFRAEQEFPADTTVTVNIGPGTPSAEGPLTTTQAQSFSFQTYAPLRIVESYCGYSGGDCPPGMSFTIRFNNPLDLASVTPEAATAEPAIPGIKVSGYYDSMELRGATAGRTSYRVTISGHALLVLCRDRGEPNPDLFLAGSPAAKLCRRVSELLGREVQPLDRCAAA